VRERGRLFVDPVARDGRHDWSTELFKHAGSFDGPLDENEDLDPIRRPLAGEYEVGQSKRLEVVPGELAFIDSVVEHVHEGFARHDARATHDPSENAWCLPIEVELQERRRHLSQSIVDAILHSDEIVD